MLPKLYLFKQVRFKRQIEDIDNEAAISVSGKDLTAGDFKIISGFQESRTCYL
jgi:hypothetical protein